MVIILSKQRRRSGLTVIMVLSRSRSIRTDRDHTIPSGSPLGDATKVRPADILPKERDRPVPRIVQVADIKSPLIRVGWNRLSPLPQ